MHQWKQRKVSFVCLWELHLVNTMKVTRLLILFLSASVTAFAQQNKIDSLKAILPSLKDTTKVKALNDLAYRTMFSSPEEAEGYANEALQLSEQIDYPKGAANAWNVKGALLDINGNYERSVDAYLSGLKILDQSNIKSFNSRLALYNGLGLVYSRKADYSKALDFFFKSFDLAEKAKYKFAIVNVLLNIGLVYYDQKEYEKALEYFFKCRDTAIEFNEDKTVAKALTNIGIVYNAQQEYGKAIEFFLAGLEIKEQTNDLLSIGASYANLADVYTALKNYPIALSYLDKAEEAKQKAGDKWGLFSVDDTRAQIFIEMGDFTAAERLLKKNSDIARELGGTAKESLYTRLHELAFAKQDYKQALEWYIRKTQYNDSLFNEAKSKQLAELQTLYEVNKKEKEITQLEKEKQKDKFMANVLAIALVCFAIIATGIAFFVRFRIKKRQEIHDLEMRLQQNIVDNSRLRELELRNEIEFKNKELTSYTMNFVQKSEVMEELKRSLMEIRSSEPEISRKIGATIRLIDSCYQVDREWEDFKLQFENVHNDFFRALKERCPELTNGDLKLCALLKLNMNMKEAAKVLGISPESVKTARYRLRKKFNLSQEDNLIDFIQNIDAGVLA